MSDKPMVYSSEDGVTTYVRASALGSCTKALIAARLGYDQMPPPDFMLQRFADGHLHEPQILQRLEDEFGMPTAGTNQMEVDLPISSRIVVRGHIDGLGLHPVYGMAVADAKALSASSYKSWSAGFFDNWPHYAWQMSAYAYGLAGEYGEPRGRPLPIVMAVKNKDSGEMRVDVFPEPPIHLSAIRVKLLGMEVAARKAELGECDQKDFLCSFKYLCDVPEKQITATTTDTQLDVVAGKYQAAKAAEAAAKKEKDELRPLLIEVLAGRTDVATDGFKVKVLTKTRKGLDKAAMKAAGIDPAAYEVESSYEELRVEEVK